MVGDLTKSTQALNPDAVGQKYDTEKLPIYQGFISYFPRAIEAVTAVSLAGVKKYASGKFPTKWAEVPDGQLRYTDALLRHMIEEAKGNLIDTGEGSTGCLHLAQQAWNILAKLEVYLREKEGQFNAGI